jgi:hypothetical protein
VALGQVFSEYFYVPWSFSFHRLLHTHHLSSGSGTIGQLVVDVPSGLSLTPRQETKFLYVNTTLISMERVLQVIGRSVKALHNIVILHAIFALST